MILYHLDRLKGILPGKSILPISLDQVPESIRLNPLYAQFEHGISNHGLQYMGTSCKVSPYLLHYNGEALYPQSLVDQQISTASMNILELVLELVRKAYFPKYPSRFESMFAVRSINDFLSWPELCRPDEIQKSNIVAIDAPNDTSCFDSKWLRGGLIHGVDGLNFYIAYSPALCFESAYNYWSGKFSDSPRMEYLLPLPISGERIHSVFGYQQVDMANPQL